MPAGAAFKYIRDVLDEAEMPEDRAGAFRGAVLGSIADLAKGEPQEAAALVLERFPEEHAAVVHSLQDQPELQYKYLQGATQVCNACLGVTEMHCAHQQACARLHSASSMPGRQ